MNDSITRERRVPFLKRKSLIKSLKVGAVYFVFGEIYIIFSDLQLHSSSQDLLFLKKMQTYKGFIFILVTSILIIYLVYKALKNQEKFYKQVNEGEKKLREIIKNSNIGAAFSNKNGDMLYVNDGLIELLGYTREEFLKMNFADFSHPDELKEEYELLQKVERKEISGYRMEKRFLNKKKEIVWTDLAVKAHRNEEDEIERFVGWVLDITEKKKLENELNLVNKAVENSINGLAISDSTLLPQQIFSKN